MERTYYQWFLIFSLFGFVVINSTASWSFFCQKLYFQLPSKWSLCHVLNRFKCPSDSSGRFPWTFFSDFIKQRKYWAILRLGRTFDHANSLRAQLRFCKCPRFGVSTYQSTNPENLQCLYREGVCNSSSFVFFQDGWKRNHYRLLPFCPSCFY